MSLARIDDRLSSTESAVDMTAATTAVMTMTQSPKSSAERVLQAVSSAGITWSASPPAGSSRMARMPTMNITPVVTSGRNTITLKARLRVAASRAA